MNCIASLGRYSLAGVPGVKFRLTPAHGISDEEFTVLVVDFRNDVRVARFWLSGRTSKLQAQAHQSPVLVGRHRRARWSHPTNLSLTLFVKWTT